jgi:hypothetical protein
MILFSSYIAKLSLFLFAKAGDACTLPGQNTNPFFFFPHWWKYLKGKEDALGNCMPNIDLLHHPTNLWLIGLAILDILLRVAGFIAVVSIVIAGFELIRSEGNTEKATNARQRLINSLIGLAIAAGATALVVFVGNTAGGGGASSGLPTVQPTQAKINDILNALFVIIGAVAVLFIVLAGVRLVASGDNPTKVSEAKRQILYAVLGLVVVAMAGTLVNFVLGRL